jgi:hypothetical protein
MPAQKKNSCARRESANHGKRKFHTLEGDGDFGYLDNRGEIPVY